MKKVLKWFGIIIALLLVLLIVAPSAIAIIILLSPLSLIGSLIASWYFKRKNPNDRFRKYVKYGTIASSVGLILFIDLATTTSPKETANHD